MKALILEDTFNLNSLRSIDGVNLSQFKINNGILSISTTEFSLTPSVEINIINYQFNTDNITSLYKICEANGFNIIKLSFLSKPTALIQAVQFFVSGNGRYEKLKQSFEVFNKKN